MSEGEEEVIVLNFWPSMFGARVTMGLSEKGIGFEYREEDVFGKKSDLLVNMNPVHQKIPVLIHNGKPVCESKVILEYIDETWKNNSPPLFPSDPYHRSQARFWIDYIDAKVFDAGRRTWTKEGKEKEEAKREVIETMRVLEGQLGSEDSYLGGNDDVTAVDLALISYYPWFHTWETFGGFSLRDETPKLMAWAQRCLTRPAISNSLPDPSKILERVSMIRNIHRFFYGP